MFATREETVQFRWNEKLRGVWQERQSLWQIKFLVIQDKTSTGAPWEHEEAVKEGFESLIGMSANCEFFALWKREGDEYWTLTKGKGFQSFKKAEEALLKVVPGIGI